VPFPLDRAKRLGLSLRPVGAGDMAFLSALYATTRAEELALTGWPEATKSLFVVHQFTAQHASYLAEFPDAERLIVEQGGAAVGRLYVDAGQHALHLIDITLLPPHCGKGWGAALIADLQDVARERATPMTLSVISTNLARRLYVRLGFRPVKKGPLYESMIWKPRR
jgi:ribosomal protein S18 acetylase RimI-like enzyme